MWFYVVLVGWLKVVLCDLNVATKWLNVVLCGFYVGKSGFMWLKVVLCA